MSKMNLLIDGLHLAMMAIYLFSYHLIASTILLFVPRMFRKKKDIKGQKVLITGAGSGVGRELAIEFSKHEVCLILVDINRQSLLQTEKLLDRRSAVFIYECDVSDYKKVSEMAKKVQDDAGDVDILVNNAGIVSGKYLTDLPEEKIRKTLEVNTLAHFWTCKAFLPAMMDKNQGHIVNIVSIAGKSGGPRVTDYCASKFAAIGFAESLELELRSKGLDGIKVTIVCPSHIDTGLFEGAKITIGSILTPAYVAKEVVIGVLEDAEIIYIPHFFKYLFMVKDFIPRWALVKLHELSGNIRVMDNFVGRDRKAKELEVKQNGNGTA